MELANYCLGTIKSLMGDQSVLTSIILSSLIFGAIALHFYFKNLYGYWQKRGVRGPKPWPVVGNLVELIVGNRVLKEREWAQKYGKVYGIYYGLGPRLVVADPDVLKQICMKDFDVFPDRVSLGYPNKHQKDFIGMKQDEHWKRLRAMLTPTFTSIKIKRMFKLLEACANDLVECFKEQFAGGEATETIVNAKDIFALYTLDAIASCCYGLKLERAGSSDLKSAATRNDFVASAMKVLEMNWPRVITALTVPGPILRLLGFEIAPTKVYNPLAQRLEKVIAMRRKSKAKFADYLQLLLDAKLNDELTLGEIDQHENHHAGLTQQSLAQDQKKLVSDVKSTPNKSVLTNTNGLKLTDQEVLSNAIFLLVVGLETTATLLTHCVYALSFHQDCQEKLYDEISKIAERESDDKTPTYSFDYDKLTSCVYLDAVISETLRCLSPIFQMDRIGNRDYKIERYNLTIPKGTILNLSFYGIMNDPDYWPEPDKFDPERFMPGRKENIYPGSYCPFGIGPRHCLGMRFSLTESKLAIAQLIMQFKFEPAPGKTFPPAPKLNLMFNAIKDPRVRLVRRRTMKT